MIDETIGSIGSTHGVSESSRPATKNAPTIDQNVPPRQHRFDRAELAAGGGGRRRRSSPGRAAPRAPALSTTAAGRDDAAAAEARQADVGAALHRRIAQARVGAALARGDQAELGGAACSPAR